jgi:hypothetical protein
VATFFFAGDRVAAGDLDRDRPLLDAADDEAFVFDFRFRLVGVPYSSL